MTDRDRRLAERDEAATGSTECRSRVLAHRMRAGEILVEHVRVAGFAEAAYQTEAGTLEACLNRFGSNGWDWAGDHAAAVAESAAREVGAISGTEQLREQDWQRKRLAALLCGEDP